VVTSRAVVLVGNPAAPYSRSLRIARTLAEAGYEVEIAAVAAPGIPDEERDGAMLVRRYRPTGPFAGMAATAAATSAAAAAPEVAPRPVARRPLPVRVVAAARRWLLWPHTVRGWWATLARDLAPADLYHACGSLTVAAALAARDRDRREGRRSVVIYDAIDDVAHGNNVLTAPRPVRAFIERRERGWARSADARTTVNDALAAALARAWGTAAPIVIPNWPDIPAPRPDARDDRIRAALGLEPSTRVVLFQGRLGPNLGLEQAAEAILDVPDAVLCLIGFGRGYAASLERDGDPRYRGRHRTLPAVHPDEILAWTASADVALIPLPPVSANQRAATPNKFWEAVAAGTPVVVGPGLPVMAELVARHGLGVVARSLAPRDLALAIRSILDVSPEAALDRRRRIAAIAGEQFTWPIAAARYRTVVGELASRPAEARAPGGPARAGTLLPRVVALRAAFRPLVRPITSRARRVVTAARRSSLERAAVRSRRGTRERRSGAARSGPITRVLLYSAANLNVIDGSSIWMESAAATLAVGPRVWVTIPLRAPEKRTLITDSLRRLERVELVPTREFRPDATGPIDNDAALDWIERLDDEEPFDVVLLRGFELCRAAIRRPRFRDRLWSAYILEPERDPESPEHRHEMNEIAGASVAVVSQTIEMQAATEERVPAARGRTILLPPAIPAAVPRADPGRPVERLIYTGKFAPFYPVPDLVDAFGRIRADHPALEFHIVGDKIWRTAEDHAYADALAERIHAPGVFWHGGLSRPDVARLLAQGGIALSVWDYRFGSHWNDLVVSTKLLDYCAAALPVVLTRTTTQARILGDDYPLFVDGVDEADAAIRRVLADPALYRAAGERAWASTRPYTYERVHEELAPALDAAAGRASASRASGSAP
jgi:glycosyltransferase involved in cell wall biosynthesis